MNADDNGQQPITDDAELAKVLDDMNGTAANDAAATGLQFEESPLPAVDDSAAAAPATPPPLPDTAVTEEPAPAPEVPTYSPVPEPIVPPTAPVGGLDEVKKDALEQLRPLVDKLNLPAEEKFDTLLLIIRSTDDQSLVQSAYDAAKAIEDETRRAQALLDVIKEIDYFANQAR